eukprot:8323395-Pyramimonas_sp.AAC.1
MLCHAISTPILTTSVKSETRKCRPSRIASFRPAVGLTATTSLSPRSAFTRAVRAPKAVRRSLQVRATASKAGSANVKSTGSDVEKVDVVVVGAGATGLTMAFTVAKKLGSKTSVVVTEARDVVGGNITTRTQGPYTWEEGPNSFQPGDPILEVACDVGLQEDILLADPGSYRFVLWDGALRALPATPKDAVFGDFLTFPGKIRAGL